MMWFKKKQQETMLAARDEKKYARERITGRI